MSYPLSYTAGVNNCSESQEPETIMRPLAVNGELSELAKTSGYSAQRLAKLLGIGLRQLERQFQESLGIPPQTYLNQLRQTEAVVLLRQPFSIKEMANQLGYKQPSHFSREFAKAHGLSPREFRRRMQKMSSQPLTSQMSLLDTKMSLPDKYVPSQQYSFRW